MSKRALTTHDANIDHIENTTHSIANLKSRDIDIGAQFADSHPSVVFTPNAQRRFLLRVDCLLMPLMFISFGLQYMDKALLSTAAQFGIIQDLHLYDIVIVDGKPKHDLVRFSYVTMIFYWGYFAGCKY